MNSPFATQSEDPRVAAYQGDLDDIARRAGVAAAKFMQMRDPARGASALNYHDIAAMAALLNHMGLSRPDLLPKRSRKSQPETGGL